MATPGIIFTWHSRAYFFLALLVFYSLPLLRPLSRRLFIFPPSKFWSDVELSPYSSVHCMLTPSGSQPDIWLQMTPTREGTQILIASPDFSPTATPRFRSIHPAAHSLYPLVSYSKIHQAQTFLPSCYPKHSRPLVFPS